MPNTASPAVASTVGLKNVVIAPVVSDTDAGVSYGTLQDFAGAIDAQISPENADPEVQFADDVEFAVVYPDPEVKLAMEMADIPLLIQEMILNNIIDDNGVLIRAAGDTPGYFALGFKSEKADGTYRFVWLFKGRAAPMTEQYHTKEGTTLTRQTGKLEFTFIKRTFDRRYQAIADEGQNGFTAEKAATFLTSVYTPVITSGT